jgi:hypothetical protein
LIVGNPTAFPPLSLTGNVAGRCGFRLYSVGQIFRFLRDDGRESNDMIWTARMALNRRNPLWPYLLVLACLFVLSIAAPRGWQRAVHENRSDDLSAERPPAPTIARPEVVRPTSIVADSPALDRSPAGFPSALDTKPKFEDPAEKIAESHRFDSSAELGVDPANKATVPMPDLTPSVVPMPPRSIDPPDTTAESANTTSDPPPMDVQKALTTRTPNEPVTPSAALQNAKSQATESAAPFEPPGAPPQPPAPQMISGWPLPQALIALLENLLRNESCVAWTEKVQEQLEDLRRLGPQECDAAAKVIAHLRRLVGEADSLVPRLHDRSAVAELRRAQYAIVRRADIWEQVNAIRRRTASSSASEGTEGLLAQIERVESNRLPSDAWHLAEIRRELLASPEPDEQELARRLNIHYRNANLRVAVAGALVDRLLPAPPPRNDVVNETVLGNPVRGQSTTSAKLSVQLIPDRQKWQFDFVTSGTIDSRTRTTHGPATFVNNAQAVYQVRKRVVIGPAGMMVSGATADVDNSSELAGLYTSFDSVPILRSLVRNYAVSQEQQMEGQANDEMRGKIAGKATRQVDAEADPRLSQAKENFRRNWVEPLRKLSLDPTALSMETTERRLSLRGRLADVTQLGAFTPRPDAPGDSLASAQVHESTLNNMLDHLDLAGRSFTLPELHRWLSAKLNRDGSKLPDDLPEGVHITFAKKDPIRVRCDDDRLVLVLNIGEIREGRRRWHDFEVRAAYRPSANGLVAQFEREGTIELGGQYKGRPELALRGIFSKVLSRERKLNLLPDTLATDPRLAGLAVTQLVVEDGWIATAIGPARMIAKREATKR